MVVVGVGGGVDAGDAAYTPHVVKFAEILLFA